MIFHKGNFDVTFQFGDGKRIKPIGKVGIPVKIGGKEIILTACVVDRNIPLLLSKNFLKKAEALLATSPLSSKIIVGIETVKGLVSASEILSASSVMGAYFGAEDYVADLGGIRTASNEEVLFARTQMGIAARLNEVPVYDQIVSDFTDTERFVNEAGKARSLGFAGKLCIHPSQVALANTSFSPSGEEIKKAKELLATYEEAVLHGSASVVFDGKMIDEALAKQARWVLSLEN